jgi:hypothetical protein
MQRDWKAVNNRLVQQGTILIDVGFLHNWQNELLCMNVDKEGARFAYPESYIRYAGIVRCLIGLEFRQLEGFLIGVSRFVKIPVPDYSTLQRRFNKLPAELHIKPKKPGEPFWLAIDASGICVTNRGEWLRKIHRKGQIDECKGFIKIHVGIDVKTKQLVSIETTTDKTADCSMFDAVLFGAINNTGNTVDTVFADGAHDTENNFEKLHDMKIKAVIPIDSNANIKPPPDKVIQRRRGEPIRRQQARIQLADPKKWRKDNQYGLRWIAEMFFSVFKGRHGDYVQAKKFDNMQHELLFKAGLYNQLL